MNGLDLMVDVGFECKGHGLNGLIFLLVKYVLVKADRPSKRGLEEDFS